MSLDLFGHPFTNKRFWDHVKIGAEDECWEWQGAKQQRGYGTFVLRGKVRIASRLVLFPPLGESALNACHTCDNPSCVNPAHLFAGTAKDNTQDMIRKGRHCFGGNRMPRQ